MTSTTELSTGRKNAFVDNERRPNAPYYTRKQQPCTDIEWYRYPPQTGSRSARTGAIVAATEKVGAPPPNFYFKSGDIVYVKSKGSKPGKLALVAATKNEDNSQNKYEDGHSTGVHKANITENPGTDVTKCEKIDGNDHVGIIYLGDYDYRNNAVWEGRNQKTIEHFQKSNQGTVTRIRSSRLLYCIPPCMHRNEQASHASCVSDPQISSETTTKILLTKTTTEYRQACLAHIQPQGNDIVMEIGCSYGEATWMIYQKCKPKYLLAIDTSSVALNSARKLFSTNNTEKNSTSSNPSEEGNQRNLAFECLDILKETKSLTRDLLIPLKAKYGPITKICADIGGNRDLTSVVRMLDWILDFKGKEDNKSSISTQANSSASSAANTDFSSSIFASSILVIVKSEEVVNSLDEFLGSSCTFNQDSSGITDKDDNNFAADGGAKCHRSGKVYNGATFWKSLRKQVFARKIQERPLEKRHKTINQELESSEVGEKVSYKCNSTNKACRQEQEVFSSLLNNPLYKHPLKAPQSFDETGNSICRYHNYHPKGCSKHQDGICPYNHTHCHICLRKGHRALECPNTIVP